MLLSRTLVPLFVLICLGYRYVNSFPVIPNNVRVDSEVELLKNREFFLYTVEEFIDRQDGSIQVRVRDEIPVSRNDSATISYYRIREITTKEKNFGDLILSYNHQLVCKPIRLEFWLLKEMTYILSSLRKSPDLNIDDLRDDRTAIGPTTLLRLFYSNAKLFKLSMKAFDELHLTDMYYFQAIVSLKDNQLAKLICLIPVATVMDGANIIVGKTLLSELKTQYHPAVLSVVLFTKGDNRIEKSPQILYDSSEDELDKLTISYNLIQGRSMAKHLGLKFGRSDEKNPFTLPSGKGCGSFATHELFFVSATQFSGIFETQSSDSIYYIAYDSSTNHLRVDSIGEYKTIYDLKERRVTYINDPDFLLVDDNEQHKKEKDIHEDNTHCAQTSIMEADDEEGFYRAQSMEQILGLDKYIGLQFLGTVLLEDGTYCMMFEREISYRQIPVIAKMKMNTNLKAQRNDRIFIVYYFVDDLLLSTKGNDDFYYDQTSYQSMWLKRIEVTSINQFSKTNNLLAQITFNEFTWNLESISEDTRDRQSKILHPVRTFDTFECKSTHDQTKLEFLIKEVDKSTFDGKKTDPSWDRNRMIEIKNQIESFEEAIIVFVSRQTGISRSLINKFELIDARATSSFEANSKLFLVKANLVMPMNYNFDRLLIGWLESIDSVPFEKYGKFVKDVRFISRIECSLILATMFYNQNKINMVYCPNTGCAYIDDLHSIEFIEKNPATMEEYYKSTSPNSCEIYVQTKVVDSSKVIGDRFTPSLIEKSLAGSQILLDIQSASQESQFNIFRGIVTKTALIKGLSLDSLGHIIRYGLCYSESVNFKKDEQFGIDITKLKLNKPHSLIYCHKACHLDSNCQTYSYSKDLNECILTNVPNKYLVEPNIDGSIELIGLEEKKDCNLYKPNSLHLYETSPIVLMNSLSAFDSPFNNDKRYYLTVAKISDCATLCHSNELNNAKRIQCRKFSYFPMNSVCAIEDKQFYLLETRDKVSNIEVLDKGKHFMEAVGKKNWFTIQQYHEYYRDFSQYYVIKNWMKIGISGEIKTKDRNKQQAIDVKSTDSKEIEEIDITGKLTLYSLEKEDCLRECAVINPNCVMVDYCFNNIRGVPTRHCSMYTVRSPFLINSIKLESAEEREKQDISSDSTYLTDLERLYYKPGNNKLILEKDYGCAHYYLAGDNLAIKRQLAEAKLNSHQGNLEVMEDLANEDLESSREYLESLRKFVEPISSSIGLLQIALTLFFGVSFGCIMSLMVSATISDNPCFQSINFRSFSAANLRHFFTSFTHGRFGRTERSFSRVNLDVELRDIKED